MGWSDLFGGGQHAFRWTNNGGMVSLGTLPEGLYSNASAVSGDGSIVVGTSRHSSGDYRAIFWSAGLGMVDLNTYLPTLGINLAGWSLSNANGISADGLTITGYGDHLYPNGYTYTEAWVATLGARCYPNCDGSTGTPLLTGNDFICFITKFAAGDTYANCDGSTGTPALAGNDFICFITAFAAGCS